MKKSFNITGVCYPPIHYMMDNSSKLQQVMEMVERGSYFTINRPRQYGKTTTLFLLEEKLQQADDYVGLKLSFEDVSNKSNATEEAFAVMFAKKVAKELAYQEVEMQKNWTTLLKTVVDLETLSEAISLLVRAINKKVILLVDEVDASSDYDAFLKFLAVIRDKYLERYRKGHETFYSIILAGVHDIKTLKYKIRHREKATYNSPWNIAADFKVTMSFSAAEIKPMLKEYALAEAVTMDISLIAEQLHYYTSGHPFLVSKLCKTISEDILPSKTRTCWILEDVKQAVNLILKENNTNFDSLIKNLENNEALYNLVYRVIIEGETIPFNPDEPITNLGRLYGIFSANGSLKVHNRIYEQRIYNYMAAKATINLPKGQNYGGHFLLENNALDIKAVLLKFQQFMKEQYSTEDKDFLERHGRLIFLSFFAPILNGQGYSFKEVQTSLEKRLDVVVTYFQHQYIIGLKRWYGAVAHQKGLNQLADYLDIHGVKEGFLIIFDDRKKKKWEAKSIRHAGKDIYAIWV